MTFTATSATTGIDDAVETQWTDSTFIEHGERYNFAYTLRDEVVFENGMQSIYHYRDVTYDVAGHMRDWTLLNVDGMASGAHSVQFAVTGTLDATQMSRLVDGGDLSFQVFLSLGGSYAPGTVPEYPDLVQPPAPPVFADTSSGTPVDLSVSAYYDPEQLHYIANVHQTFTAPRDLAAYDHSYLIYANEELLSDQAAFMIHGPGYDAGTRNLGYSEFLGIDVLPVPEPGTWMMLVAGAGVLAAWRRSR
ncbi:PEP-CTERM sorting domain-containing protein [Pseudoduganella umbonata]|uniref:PEP-CTERM sorting domain-containing protein n=1 Tax=Pseudoduganella umbonata TaxID=864828 RepID=A0A4P8HU04_9BURK|nr:PEP-CTERM sorting domain-containing protein [Pseudoduganella umbonata]MBB3220247.1 hypothetical protein [Pseudoduganella umbonata]QCP12208.1 PEP-CTERM sorting domain-containing protein [Pseudoduganella umbonata]